MYATAINLRAKKKKKGKSLEAGYVQCRNTPFFLSLSWVHLKQKIEWDKH